MEGVPSALADAEVLDPGGIRIRVADLWGERPVVLAFVRQFG